MYNTYIARQAILDRNAKTIGYELLFRDSQNNEFPEIDPDIASSKLIVENHIHGDILAISMNKLAFINFTEKCLINKYPLMFDPSSIVIELVGHTTTSERLLKITKFYHEKGYKVALTEYNLDEQWDVLFPFISLIKVDIEKINPKRLKQVMMRTKAHGIKLVAEKVETNLQLQSLAEIGFNFYQGFFYHRPEMIEGKTLAPFKTQMLNLMSETFKTPLNFEAIAEIISHDVNLSIGLLKMVNNVATGTQVELTSIKQAATYLGEEKLKQFVSILALSKLSSEQTEEAAKQALIIGKLMHEIARKSSFKDVLEYAFITGLLSSIEAILKMPLNEILATMPVAQPIKEALLHGTGKLGIFLSLIQNYVNGDDETINEKLQSNNLEGGQVHSAFVDACRWCSDINGSFS
ncbi:EAL and HDOD domain-containing protein [Thalassotalea atypica]|uniref:EAL and HDOD domain-containing protein n=1 Tax=Thalassotalea atypica TaxID=2054316 RepID=UPI0025736F82|nr:HDOD domain-containing protein [Thalassotalea atypica]